MKAWALFHPLVLLDAMGAPDPVVNQALCLATREFCERTRVWLEWQDPVTPTPDSNQYDFDVPSTQELVRVMRAVVGDRDLDVLAEESVPADWQDLSSTALHDTLVQIDTSSYLIFPNTEAVRLQLAMKPALNATSCGDVLYDSWAEEIASGAKARLLLSSTAEYFNPTLAAVNKGMFEAAVNRAANRGWAKRSASQRRTKKAGL